MNLNSKYMDLHVHTNESDGNKTPEEIIAMAKKYDIGVLAITDHNRMLPPEWFAELKKLAAPEVLLLYGSEVSCRHLLENGEVELHCVCLFPDETVDLTSFRNLLAKNADGDRKSYIDPMLKKLRTFGIDLGTFEKLKEKYQYIGRPQLAAEAVELGYAKSCEEFMDEWIGTTGKRKAYVEHANKKNFCTLKTLIEEVRKAKGLIILCHLKYYQLESPEERELVSFFSKETAGIGGLEVFYFKYPQEVMDELAVYADEYGLFYSAASDYHGVYANDNFDNKCPGNFGTILKRWCKVYNVDADIIGM